MTRRCLFVVRDLPRTMVSVDRFIDGEEPLSGTHGSGLLVAEGLARRGIEIGLHVARGQAVAGTALRSFAQLGAAIHWVGSGPVIYISHGDHRIVDDIRAEGRKPIVWIHTDLTPGDRASLEQGDIDGIIAVSDSARMPMLRSTHHRRVGRIYNPLAPVFTNPTPPVPDRYERRVVAYAGAAGPTKGLHQLLEMWRFVHRADARARLLLAGTGRLYGHTRVLGDFGIATPEFEAQWIAPLVEEFGSLAAAGIEPLGMLSPRELRDVYSAASLGVVNMNWNEYTETFCCAAVEMLGTALPVFSVARGALPETIGLSGGAFLTQYRQGQRAAVACTTLLANPTQLAQLGAAGQRFVRTVYDWERILDDWERLLGAAADLEALCGPWRGPRSVRYVLELVAGRVGAPWVIDLLAKSRRLAVRAG